MTLKSLGYSANSENPAEIEQALDKLIALKPNVILIEDFDPELETSAPLLLQGQVVMAVGWSYDALEAREQSMDVIYVLPEEGALLWQDTFVIPANSRNAYTAEVFLNFMLRPEISAKITNFNRYPNAVEKSKEFINPEILFDPLIYPDANSLKNAEMIESLSEEGEALYENAWKRFLEMP